MCWKSVRRLNGDFDVRRPFGQLLTTIARALTIFISGPLRVFEVIVGRIRQSRTLVSPIVDYDIEMTRAGIAVLGWLAPPASFPSSPG
jgi:hypothetical protein